MRLSQVCLVLKPFYATCVGECVERIKSYIHPSQFSANFWWKHRTVTTITESWNISSLQHAGTHIKSIRRNYDSGMTTRETGHDIKKYIYLIALCCCCAYSTAHHSSAVIIESLRSLEVWLKPNIKLSKQIFHGKEEKGLDVSILNIILG